MAQESFIICDNVVRIFKIAGHDVVALQGLDMAVAPAELLGVVGVSGSGKSTLMNILGGLDRPTAGRVWVDGKDLLKLSDMALTRYRLSRSSSPGRPFTRYMACLPCFLASRWYCSWWRCNG